MYFSELTAALAFDVPTIYPMNYGDNEWSDATQQMCQWYVGIHPQA